MHVLMTDHTANPIRTLYEAFKTCYSEDTPALIHADIESGDIEYEAMEAFILRQSAIGHTSPYQQVWFEFAISGISRACSHQFITHHVGMSKTQQSQRYVNMAEFEPVRPPSIKTTEQIAYWLSALQEMSATYSTLVEAGVPEEDARYILPNATPTNLKITINLRQLQLCCDERLCTTAQWEIRKLFSLLRKEVVVRWPIFGPMLGPKCLASRGGFCTESTKTYNACPLSAVRPHKRHLLNYLDQHDPTEDEMKEVEDYVEEASAQ